VCLLRPPRAAGNFGRMTSGAENNGLSRDYLDRFGGVGRLFGAASLARLQASHVAVIGVGGVGSWVVEGLARSGVGALTLVDLDDVCLTNVNRQLPALDGQIGRPKITVLAERVRLINPECRVEAAHEFFTEKTAERLLAPRFDFVVDAVDRMSHKALLIAGCRDRGVPVLTIGAAGGRRDATRIHAGDIGEAGDELLRQVRKKLRRDYAFAAGAHRGITRMGVACVWSSELPVFPWADGTCAAEPEPGSNLKLDCESGFGTAAFVTGAFGLVAAGEVVRRLVGVGLPATSSRWRATPARGVSHKQA
jgi:tRNA A37 threonylcarbamoyladenosine dehydratase